MPAPEEISKLVERYTNNHNQYRSSSYREADVRLEFLDPLFKALDWDVDNTQGNAPQYRDVVTEESLEVEGSIKTPDYSFRLSGTTKFFVEAKKPSVDICSDKMPAFQLKRYAWSAKLPLSILTNFEDISVYDCRFKPVKNDDPTKGRILYIPFTDLVERWDELVEIFTKDAILKGSFDKYAQAKKKGTSEVDAEILKEIEGWREDLAKNIAKNNEFTTEEVNFAVQRLIDRILFLRICEDRKTEPENQLYDIMMNKKEIYRHMIDVFQLADAKYNSGLFHFTHDKSRSTKPDRLMRKLIVDDKVLANILWDLYYPNSPYQFDVIPADILGQVYEQFLGKVIKLSASGKTAKIEEKQEVKKAGGVYYTPTYIVKYIVDNTVEKLCEGKNLKELAKIKILDPACGSGSFLIVAYQKMLDKHLEWYMANKPKNHKDQVFQKREDEWQLTLQEKKRILLNNIHGVDIDSQAVEVTKLNLLLKALEGESKESIANVKKWFREPALPDLGSNIKCGNSLIDFDIIDHLQDLSDDERDNELNRINPFSWQEEFPDIMKVGGFDAVVGNPPYIRIQTMKEWAPVEVEHYKRVYQSASKGNYDIYVVFIEKALQLINKNGKMGYICPHKFFQAKYGQPIREIISEGKQLDEIVHFGDIQIFDGATTYTCLFFLSNSSSTNFEFIKVNDLNAWKSGNSDICSLAKPEDKWSFVNDTFLHNRQNTVLLKSHAHVFQGLATSADSVYVLELIEKGKIISKVWSRELEEEIEIENSIIYPLLKGAEILRYNEPEYENVVLFPYLIENGKAVIVSHNDLMNDYPLAYEYLERNKDRLLKRSKVDPKTYWHYPYPKNLIRYNLPKIMVQVLSSKASFTLDTTGKYYFLGGGTAGGNAICLKSEIPESFMYILGMMNSSVLTYFVKQIGSSFRGGYFSFGKGSIGEFPIRTINFDDPNDKARHDKMVKLVERMLKLHKDVKEASTPDAETRVQRQIEAADRGNDGPVYE